MKTVTGTPELDSFMLREVTKNLLKYAAGQAITCPTCGSIMDWKRTCIIEVHQGESTLRTYALCAACWDKAKAGVEAAMAKKPMLTLEVTDGRTF